MEALYLGECGVSGSSCQDREPLVGRAVLGNHLEAVSLGKVHDDVVEGPDTLPL